MVFMEIKILHSLSLVCTSKIGPGFTFRFHEEKKEKAEDQARKIVDLHLILHLFLVDGSATSNGTSMKR